jgi:hypothetical protein
LVNSRNNDSRAMHATPLEWPRAAPAKASSFDVTPDGPLNAGFALSPLSTSSPRKQAWEAKARSYASKGAFGSITPGVKTVALAEDTARGDGVLARRVADDDATPSLRPTPRVIDAETILGVAAAAAARATPHRTRASPTQPARVVASTPRPTARALDFDPRADPDARLERARRAFHPDISPGAPPISPREQARDALLAFLDDKATLRFAKRAQRRAFSLWRDALTRASPRDTDASNRAREREPLRAAIRGWRLAAEATRARREVETLQRRLADATLVPASASPRASTEPARPRTERSFASPPDSPVRAYDPTHPMYGKMDDKLARWLGMDEPPTTSRVDVDAFSDPSAPPPSWESYRAAAPEFAPRLDAMETLLGAAREAEARAEALAEENRALETDLYAAAVLWEETERENAILNARVERLAEELEEARAATMDARWGRGRGRDERYPRGSGGGDGDGWDSPPRRSSSRSRRGAGSVRSEVEELEECAAAMRRQMRRRARGERVFARGREDDW